MTLNFSIATDAADIDACLALRRTVFIEEQQVPEDIEMDGEEDICTHFLATLDGVPVGAARLKYLKSYAKLQRVCVLREHRGKHIGAELMKFMIDHVRAEGKVASARLGSQVHALAFYEKLGFQVISDEYFDAGIPHREMELPL